MGLIRGEIPVNADVESVWSALTDYERLADFIPNLVKREDMVGAERVAEGSVLAYRSRVVLDLRELINSENNRELHFSMVDGDFKKFEGKWSVKSQKGYDTVTNSYLGYEVNVIPRFNFPAIFLERIIRSDLPVNLLALACRSESSFEGNQNEDVKENFVKAAFGPLSPSTGELTCNWGIFGKSCPLDRPCLVDEVHLRRFDGLLENGGVHRCVIASITVKAPVREVWNILTAYERLPEKDARVCCIWFSMLVSSLIYVSILNKRSDLSRSKETLIHFEGNGS
ncbi:hypothetical protein SASPL_156115 [Salvia splendens]|uniref:Coenzyme Q-binding protein COQ10 START domain-containing protein n=1 Tax=Salvia splendens TaxID=180675 RepID=A0A8X8YYC1_SALSN|nr:hypothetical protein SASPL_156115 [Salvia splendens]